MLASSKIEMKVKVIYNICIFIPSMCIYTTCKYLNIITSWCVHLKTNKKDPDQILYGLMLQEKLAAPETSSDQWRS